MGGTSRIDVAQPRVRDDGKKGNRPGRGSEHRVGWGPDLTLKRPTVFLYSELPGTMGGGLYPM